MQIISVDRILPAFTGVFNLNPPRICQRQDFSIFPLKVFIVFYF